MTAFDVQQKCWRRYCDKRDAIIKSHPMGSVVATRLISYAWLTYRRQLRKLGIVATNSGWKYKEVIK